MARQEDDREVHAYEKMLDRIRHALGEFESDVGPRLRLAVEQARERAVELGELTREEANRIGEYLRRDIEQAADYTTRNSDQDLRGWARMDLQLIEDWLWDRFSSVADQTRLDWIRFEQQLEEANTYHTGEIAGPGTLTCQNCEEQMQFRRPGRIPPCPHCHGTAFDREVR